MGFHVVNQVKPGFAVIEARTDRFAGHDGLTRVGVRYAILSQRPKETRVVTGHRWSWVCVRWYGDGYHGTKANYRE